MDGQASSSGISGKEEESARKNLWSVGTGLEHLPIIAGESNSKWDVANCTRLAYESSRVVALRLLASAFAVERTACRSQSQYSDLRASVPEACRCSTWTLEWVLNAYEHCRHGHSLGV